MWLLRGLSFTCKALQNSQADKTKELSAAFTSSYDGTLKKFHGILIRPVFAVCYIASPCIIIVALPFPAKRGGQPGGNMRAEIFSHLWIGHNLFFLAKFRPSCV